MNGVAPSEVKDEMIANGARREELKASSPMRTRPPPLLHPHLAALYREKVATLASALQTADSRLEAAEDLRGLVDAILHVPAGTCSESN